MWLLLVVLLLPSQTAGKPPPDTLVVRQIADKIRSSRFENTYPDSIFYYASKGLDLAKELSYDFGVAEMKSFLGLYYWAIGDFSPALENYQEASRLYKLLGRNREFAAMNVRLGIVYRRMGDLDKAIKYHYDAIDQLEQLEDEQPELAKAVNSLGNTYRDFKDYQSAAALFKRSMQLNWEIGDSVNFAGVTNNLGTVYYLTKSLDSAKYYYFESLRIFEKLNNIRGRITCYINIGQLYIDLKDYGNALIYSSKANELGLERGFGEQRITALTDLSKIAIGTERYDEALEYLKSAEELAIGNKSPNTLVSIYDGFMQCYRLTGRHELALKYYDRFMEMRDSVYKQENAALLANLRIASEINRKDAEISLLTKNNQLSNFRYWITILIVLLVLTVAALIIISLRSKIRKERFAVWKREQALEHRFKMRTANLELTALKAQMNPHFIFNSLSSINNYIIKSDIESASSYLSKFGKLMRMILDNSMNSKITLSAELESVELYLQMESIRFKNKFSYEIKVSQHINTSTLEVPAMIIQPYAENSIWHGLMHRGDTLGKLSIHVDKQEDFLVYIIEDNGVGREEAAVRRTKDVPVKKSYGMQITSSRLRLLTDMEDSPASVEIFDLSDNGTATGTKVIVKLPTSSLS